MDISVIIPTKDRLWSLPKAVASCLQSDLNVEIIVVDDGSTDGTWEWLKAQSDIVSIRLGGWGKPFAVNRAFALCKGEFVRFLDSDDWLPAGTLDEQVAMARAEGADLVVAGYQEMNEAGKFVRDVPWMHCDDFVSQQLGECTSSHYSAFTFRRPFVEDIPHRSNFPSPHFATRDDRCFMLEVAMLDPKFAISNMPGLCHRHHGRTRLQTVSGFSADAANLNIILVYQQVLSQLDQSGRLTPRRRQAAAGVLGQVAEWLADRELPTALSLLDVVEGLQGGMPKVSSRVNSKLSGIVGRRNYFKIRSLRRTILDLFAVRREHASWNIGSWLR